jgi:hypothetical protein
MEEVKKSTIRSNSVIGVHHVKLNEQKLFDEVLKAPSSNVPPVLFTLSEDTSVMVVTDRLRTTDHGLSWVGHIQDNPRSSVLILADTKTRTISGDIRIDGKVYEIRPGERGSYAVFAIEPSRLPPDHSSEWYETPSGSHVPRDLFPSTATSHVPRSLSPSTATMGISPPVIDVMVLYTQKAINADLSYNIAQQICDAIAQVNESFIDSGVTARVRLVHRGRINFIESGDPMTDAQHLMEKTFGSKSAHTNRSKYGADLVSLWIGDEGVDMCGASYAIIQPGGSGSARLAFSVVRRNCATDKLTFAHELGHLMGAYHDRFNAGASTDPNHNYGYILPDKNWKTIMAVDRMDCPLVSSNNHEGTVTTIHSCVRLKVWSNLAKTSSAGDAMGRPDEIDPTGCATKDLDILCDGPADNATTLNDNASAVSQFKPTKVLGNVSCSIGNPG